MVDVPHLQREALGEGQRDLQREGGRKHRLGQKNIYKERKPAGFLCFQERVVGKTCEANHVSGVIKGG